MFWMLSEWVFTLALLMSWISGIVKLYAYSPLMPLGILAICVWGYRRPDDAKPTVLPLIALAWPIVVDWHSMRPFSVKALLYLC